jgi:hypothetical protein
MLSIHFHKTRTRRFDPLIPFLIALLLSAIAHGQPATTRRPPAQPAAAPLPQSPSPDTWTIRADSIDPAHYFGVTVANGMIGIVSSADPFRAKDIVLQGAFDLYGRGRVSNILKTFNFVNG